MVQCGCGKKFNNKSAYAGHRAHCDEKEKPNAECAWCGKKIRVSDKRLNESKSGKVFCCRKHKDKAQRFDSGVNISPEHYGKSEYYRTKKLRNSESKICERCGENLPTAILEVHHIDGNRNNNSLDNLELLCPNCHALEHYKGGVTQ